MDLAALPVTALKGVGPKLAEKLKRLGFTTVQDVLFHLPFRYQDRTRLTPLGALQPNTEALVTGRIELADVVYRGRRALICRIEDGTGHLHLRFFYFTTAQREALKRDRSLRCFGEVRFGPAGLEMTHPEYTLLGPTESACAETHLTPIYSTTAGVHQLSLRKMAQQAIDHYLDGIHEWLPSKVLAELELPTLKDALIIAHRPPPGLEGTLLAGGRHPAQKRLAFEELLAHHLSLRRLRERLRTQHAPSISVSSNLMTKLQALLPFALTGAQQRVLAEITRDLSQPHPMQRLIQGDVGSGKTVVAVCAALMVVESGFQAALMAPTELLAEQHCRTLGNWLMPLDVAVVGLSGKHNGRERREALEKIGNGSAAIIVGTHALFQEGVDFFRLGLVIVDEQHRFGVHQRLSLRSKGATDGVLPHQLIMTATPIPRTLAQSVYADLDVSVIDELPSGRQPVETVAVPATRRAELVDRVRVACRMGRQAYWVCPLIEETETLALQTATDTALKLRTVLPELNIALIHGRLRPLEKERIMMSFNQGEVDLLVATTVVEVGVDVPNASLMIIENAERLGLAQLHQLRGRVGRGAELSSCVLMYQSPLSELARERLAVLRSTNDGFEIARKDLEMRGPGEVLGTRQTGLPEFQIADILRDQELIPSVQQAAEFLLVEYPDRVEPIIRRWLGGREDYGGV